MKKLFLFILISLSSKISGQNIYSIPWATTQPKFVFPIYFEEAAGMKDTIYFCFDPRANFFQPDIQDSVFGQKLVPVDTTRFYAYIQSDHLCSTTSLVCDSQYKVSVAPLSGGLIPHFPFNWTIIGFHNGTFPLKISWDISTLYSDSLPFPFSSGLPKAQGSFRPLSSSGTIQFGENGQYWPASSLPYNILVTDTGTPALKDSCNVFTINGGGPFEVENFGFSLSFEEWTGIITHVNELPEFKNKIFYDCNSHELFFETIRCSNYCNIQIVDISGKILSSFKLNQNNQINTIPINLMNGIYFVIIELDNNRLSKSFLVIE